MSSCLINNDVEYSWSALQFLGFFRLATGLTFFPMEEAMAKERMEADIIISNI